MGILKRLMGILKRKCKARKRRAGPSRAIRTQTVNPPYNMKPPKNLLAHLLYVRKVLYITVEEKKNGGLWRREI